MTAMELRRQVATKQISPVELTRHALDRAAATQATLNAFVTLMPDEAFAAARAAEDAVMRGAALGLLHGLPISVKDLIAVKDVRFTSGSRVMADNVATVDAPAVERVRAAGAVIIGKTTTSEFGCKPVGDSPLTGVTRNPWDLGKTPGGSSAGAAASVAAGITPFALGTDGGGSIRIPCSFTGLTGLKGQFGRVPVWPTSATPTLAHVGPIARNVADIALLFSVIAGYDARDPHSVPGPVPDVFGMTQSSLAGLRVAYSRTLGYARPDPAVLDVIDRAAATFETLGCHVDLVDAVFDRDPVDLWAAEFYAGVSIRLRGVLGERREMLDPAISDILHLALSQQMSDYYVKVFERYSLRDSLRCFFETYDLLISPVLPVSSLEVGCNIPISLADRNLISWVFYTYPFNLTGNPAGTICAGMGVDGMPVGLQIVGRGHAEGDVVRALAAFERAQPAGYSQLPQGCE
jgi:aspartyl-tRNA(Asn)/glutamyl-tRNA(Gln) amidotransferase subunit A